MSARREPCSFRDPSGFIFERDGRLYRQINAAYVETWQGVLASGLYESLQVEGLMVAFSSAPIEYKLSDEAAEIIAPERLAFVSYPYEWSFSRLRDAAILTLEIQRIALGFGFTLKDASAYNIQFKAGSPVHIDSLSFEARVEGEPWIAYAQFCRHFLAPLALMSFVNESFGPMLQSHLDGYPLPLASSLLPMRTKFNPGLLAHLHLHARASRAPSQKATLASAKISNNAMLGMLDSLEQTIVGLKLPASEGTWSGYYGDNSYDESAYESKKQLVGAMLAEIGVRDKTVWDLGANTGVFSDIAAAQGANVIAWDSDPATVDAAYLRWKSGKKGIEALIQNLASPSPGLGWAGAERQSFEDRGPADVLLALALIHHLAIGNQVPFSQMAPWFASLGKECVIEFVPKEDVQVQRLLNARADVFNGYTEAQFQHDFGQHFEIIQRLPIVGQDRTLYRLRRK